MEPKQIYKLKIRQIRRRMTISKMANVKNFDENTRRKKKTNSLILKNFVIL